MNNKQDKKPPLGRPRKGKDRRLQIGVYLPGSLVDIIDDYAENRQAELGKQYSRSDFINEAIEKCLKDLGIFGGGEDAQG